MAPVYRNIELHWKGQAYSVIPTMRLIQEIEQKFSLTRVAHRIQQGDPPLSHMSEMISILLRAAGAKASPDEVFADMMAGDPNDVMNMSVALIEAAFPMQPKKEAAPTPKTKKVPSKSKRKATPGG